MKQSRITESLYKRYRIANYPLEEKYSRKSHSKRKPLKEGRKNRRLYESTSYPEDRMIVKNIEWDMDTIELDKDAFDTEEEYLDFVESLPKRIRLPKDIAYEYYYEFDDDEEEEAEEFVKDWISEWYGTGYPIKSLEITDEMLESFNRKSLREGKRNRKLNESSYSEPLFERIEDALYNAGLNVTRFNEAGLVTMNLGWVVSDDDGNEVQMECLGTW